MKVKELKEIIANVPDDFNLCVIDVDGCFNLTYGITIRINRVMGDLDIQAFKLRDKSKWQG
jgi:hypothetical protein